MTSRRKLIGSALAGALLFVACGSSDDGTGESSASAVTEAPAETEATAETEAPAVTEAPVETDAATTAAANTTSPTTDPPSTDAAQANKSDDEGDGACLVGEWVVSEEEMNAFYEGVTSTLSAPVTISVEGSAPISFHKNGTYAWAPAFTLTVEVAGQVGTGVSGGAITGDWAAVDGVLTTAADINALEVQITVAGATFDESDFANGLLNGSPINGVTYSCDGPTPVLDFQTGDPEITVPVALMPA